VAAARHGEEVTLAPEAIAAMWPSRTVVEEVLSKGDPVYGTGHGLDLLFSERTPPRAPSTAGRDHDAGAIVLAGAASPATHHPRDRG
jgi:hypothetical protein